MGKNEVLISLSLADGDTTIQGAQLLPIGKWKHPHGVIDITPERAKSFAEQFNKRVAGQDLPILYIHSDKVNVPNPNYGKAAGWITGVKADEARGVLIDIKFTEAGAKAVRDREFRYLSAEYFDRVQLPHHRAPEKDVLVGASLVNRPHLKGMNPILNEETGHQFLFDEAQDNETGGGPVDPILVQLCEAAGVELAEDAETLTEPQQTSLTEWLTGQANLSTQLSEEQGKRKDAEKRLSEIEDPDKAKQKSLAEAGFVEEAADLADYRAERFARTLGESLEAGKKLSPVAVKAAKQYSLEGKKEDLDNLLTLALTGKAVVDLTEKGTSESGDDDTAPTELGDKLVALATKRAKEDEIEFAEAMSLVVAENPEDWKQYQLALGSSDAAGGAS